MYDEKRRSFEPGNQSLLGAETSPVKRPRRKEFANNIGRRSWRTSRSRPMLQKKVFVLPREGSALGQFFIPISAPNRRPEYPYELPSARQVEPWRRWVRMNHARPSRVVFSAWANTPKIRISTRSFSPPHASLIGLNAEYGIPIFRAHLREDAGAESDISDPGWWSQAATHAQKLHDPIDIQG